jgi:urease accessory protein
MNIRNTLGVGAAGITCLFAAGVEAHTFGAAGAGLTEGLIHPFIGIDHLLAMLAVGIWAAQLGGRSLWLLPLAFVAVMAGGAGLAQLGLDLSLVEVMIAVSVLALGSLVAGSIRVSAGVGVLTVSLFALFHGYAHGLELPEAGTPLAYAAGFVLATTCLHLIGIGVGIGLRQSQWLTRIGGAALSATGVYLLASL